MKLTVLQLLAALLASLVPDVRAAPSIRSLDRQLEAHRTRADLPALAAAIVRHGTVIAAGAVGSRMLGRAIPVTVHDRFHLGSDTKAMTALLAGMLVEEKKLRWDSNLAEIFPDLASRMHSSVRPVTLQQLLSHTSGLPSDNEQFESLLEQAVDQNGNLDSQRRWLLEKAIANPLEATPGSRFAYSNLGYTLVGAVLEQLTGRTWEELIHERVFRPLELHSAGLGCQASLGRTDAPLGHADFQGKLTPFLAGPNCDNPPVIGPAGTAHMSVLDFARWAGWNAGEAKRGPALVRPETLRKVHTVVIHMEERKEAKPGTPTRGGYALGWGEVAVDWAPAPLLQHTGSNTRNLAQIWVDRQRDFGIVVLTNISRPETGAALTAVVKELYGKYSNGSKR